MIEVYSFLDGKNICNIFASLIVEKINETFPDAETEITVINVRNFFVVKGRTNSDVVINCSDLLKDFIKDYDEEFSKKINIIDVIYYNTKVENVTINLNYQSNKKIEKRKFEIESFINDIRKKGISITLQVDDDSKYVFFDSDSENTIYLTGLLSTFFSDYYIVRSNFSNYTYTSDRYYGLSNNTEKYYHVLLKNITKHLFDLNISNNVDIKLMSDKKIYEISNLNCKIKLNECCHIVKTDWLESLILDIFPFEYSEIKDKYNFSKYKSHEDVTSPEKPKVWDNLIVIKDFILI
jgi:hypothetical protein